MKIDPQDVVGSAAMELAVRLIDDGAPIPDVSCSFITVGVSVAEAAAGKAEAIQLLYELIDDLKSESN